ncbi:hypothetical protein [Kitasatospora sp. KL5]|uniref:hypothetical protein n=1 Tax=Kitasatospora sp. KL5 TaxID=3425125 RepID=UPI003D6F5FD6
MTGTEFSEVDRRLRAVLDSLGETAAGSFTVRESGEDGCRQVAVEPRRRDALGFWWSHCGGIVLGVDVRGVSWELQPTAEDLDFLAEVVRSVAAGRVRAVLAPGRAEVTVFLADGTCERRSSGQAPVGCLPLPLWPRWGRRLEYAAYR